MGLRKSEGISSRQPGNLGIVTIVTILWAFYLDVSKCYIFYAFIYIFCFFFYETERGGKLLHLLDSMDTFIEIIPSISEIFYALCFLELIARYKNRSLNSLHFFFSSDSFIQKY